MVEPRRTVFVSCGQYTDEEKDLGKRVCDLVTESTIFDGYFAQNQTTLKTLTENVLRRLYESVGLIVIMHHRGRIEGHSANRASVWIEQEIAIATLMEQVLGRTLHVVLFVQRGIAVEGIRQQIQLNPIEFASNDEVIVRLREILPTWTKPLYLGDEERRKIADSILLSIKTDNGHHRNYTIQIENHSEFAVEIKWICLWSKGQKISKPVFRPEGAPWSVRAHGYLPILFDAQEDVPQRLWKLAGSPPANVYTSTRHLPGHFDAEVSVMLRCEILGLEREFEETRTVQVDFLNRQITGL
jgi:hypothetical protein